MIAGNERLNEDQTLMKPGKNQEKGLILLYSVDMELKDMLVLLFHTIQ